MKINIAENIRKYRKERGMTQERLAEVLGVTVGAVSKWESGASMPDISLIVEMADFFETSVDVLLGYGWLGGNMKDAIAQIKALRNEKRFDEATVEAEKALERYPNSFDVTFACAALYRMKGLERKCEKSHRRALALFERSLVLIGQNTDPEINEWSIRNHIADLYLCLGQTDKALEQMKANNVNGLNNDRIGGTIAAQMKEPDEALSYLSAACIGAVSTLMRVSIGYVNAYGQKNDHASALAVSQWMLGILEGLKKPGVVSYMDKLSAPMHAVCATIAAEMGDCTEARRFLSEAKESARRFDAAPVYGFQGTRFFHGDKSGTAFDDFGATAELSIEHLLHKQDEDAEALLEIWEEIQHESDI